jgi:hypothetical protein
VRRYCVGNLSGKECEEMAGDVKKPPEDTDDVKKPPDDAENDVTYDPPDFRGLDDRRDDDADDDRGDLTHLIGT